MYNPFSRFGRRPSPPTSSALIQLRIPRGNSGDDLPCLENSFQALEIVADDVFERKQPRAYPVLRQRKNPRLSAIQNRVRPVLALERALLNIVRGVNQVAQD